MSSEPLMVTAADYPNRPAVYHLTYRGDRTGLVLDPKRLGPNAYGEHLYPVTGRYDPATNKTRIGLTPIAPPAVAAETRVEATV